MPEILHVERLYHVSDDTMLERVNTIQNLFADDLTDFTGFDSDFNGTFRDAWVADREAAEALDTDETIQDQTKTFTEAVEAAMAAGRDKWNEIQYFIQKAFPDAPGKRDELGEDDYGMKSVVTKAFIGFLKNLHTKAVKYHVLLIAAKYTQPQIDEIATIHTTLHEANEAQEDWKKTRLGLTEDRKIAMNKVYTTMQHVNKAAQIIYIGSEAKRSQYVFDPNGGGGSEPTEFTGPVPPAAIVSITTVTYDATKHFTLTNPGDTSLRFSLNNAPGEPEGTPVDVNPGENTTVTMADMNGPAGTILQVKNLSEVSAGSYVVTVG